MDALGGCGTLYIDGTFRSCPHPYNQVFTILGNVEGFVVPLVNVLMENRTTGSYRQIFQKVKGFIRRRTHHHWRPHRVIADFEIALWNALEIELPHTLRCGCYFHLTQSFWKKIQQLSLAQPYMMNQRLHDTLRKVMALGYLPLAVLRNNFLALRQSRRTRRLVNTFPSLQDFLNYVENNYILPTAAFPPAVWNVHNRNRSQRTNNHAENYHRMQNEAIAVRHPSLWVFIRVLKGKQSQTENALEAAERGDAPPARRKKWCDLEERLLRLKAQYNAGQRNLDSFWRAVARSVWPLWRRRVPRYPVYWQGNPQLQMVMPHFWMKLVRPKRDIPNTQVRFIVHPQMSVFDIKNYLEKIYDVPVLDVKTKVMAGGDIKHPYRGHVVAKEDDYKVAFIQLKDGVTFEFPDLFEENKSPSEKQVKEVKKQERAHLEQERKDWDKLNVPPWFR